MNEWDKNNIVQDISYLAKYITDNDIPCSTGELQNIENTLPHSTGLTIIVKNIVFEITKKISKTIPYDIKTIEISLSNTCKFVSENIGTNKDVIGEKEGDYNFQIDIIGWDEDGKDFYACWHLDKNIKSAPPKYTHPLYHLQFGGNTMGEDVGKVLLLGSPRIPHPPMDLFLGFHFIINNFYSSKDYTWVKDILNDGEYQEIIVRAQKRMWEPYFSAYSGKPLQGFTQQQVFPLYIQ